MHLAELNIAKLRYEKGDPRAAEFFDNLDRINGLGERMPGFIWRLKDDGGNATAFEVNEDPMVIANLTVWEGVEALEKFVWQTVHNTGFYRKRSEWFEKMDKPHFVMWWVEEGHLPDLKEALGRLAHLTEHGPSNLAFGWAQTPGAQLWRNARCG